MMVVGERNGSVSPYRTMAREALFRPAEWGSLNHLRNSLGDVTPEYHFGRTSYLT